MSYAGPSASRVGASAVVARLRRSAVWSERWLAELSTLPEASATVAASRTLVVDRRGLIRRVGAILDRFEDTRTPLVLAAEAVVLRAFGVGNVPSQEPGLTAVVERAIAAGTAVVVASQCHEAEVLPGRYEASDAIARAGAVGSRDMTLEATYAKVQFLLAQGLRGAELAEWMSRSIAGELTESHDR